MSLYVSLGERKRPSPESWNLYAAEGGLYVDLHSDGNVEVAWGDFLVERGRLNLRPRRRVAHRTA